MHEIDMTADELVSALMTLASTERVCLLDSCGVGHLGSHLMVAGIAPVETFEFSSADAGETLRVLDRTFTGDNAVFLTLSYEFGAGINSIQRSEKPVRTFSEPDVFAAVFDCLIVHDYDKQRTFLTGIESSLAPVEAKLRNAGNFETAIPHLVDVSSNFTKREYLENIEAIKERIRCGDTYQTNLTQRLTAELPASTTPERIFLRLREHHPAPFAAFIKRSDSTVVSASPERFFKVEGSTITTSPIKGTRPRSRDSVQDEIHRHELRSSHKDIAENTMIVDLLRNDLGRVCEFGSVRVEKLCDLEEHPTLFHLVSTVTGELKPDVKFSEILRAMYPCGSITGAPKISTMRIIDEIETADRGLSMGSIGYYIPHGKFDLPAAIDLSVAIRTIVVKDQVAAFNVGGGIVIDSDPDEEYLESLTKAKALLDAINGRL